MTDPEGLVGLDEVREAAGRLKGVVVRTPLLAWPELSERLGGEVRLKCENLQRSGSFKARGAFNFASRIPAEELKGGLITYSSGNHAQAVALVAQLLGTHAVVVMPVNAPAVKREGAARLGAEVVLEGTTSVERRARAEIIADERGLAMVPPFDHPHIIAGQGTVGLEIVHEWGEVDTVLVPIGGGGLASGVSAAVRRLRPDARIFGVEPSGAASMRAALDAGEPVELSSIDSIADGLLPVRTGDHTYRHIRDLADDVLLVEDDAIVEAALLLATERKLLVEFSGAATAAAILSGRVDVTGRKVVAVLSGGNVDPAVLVEHG